MTTKVNVAARFLKELRHLAKKYQLVIKEAEALTEQLKNDERPGDKIPHVGHDVYKVRLSNPSAGRGKSGGFRVIYYVYLVNTVYLLRIYSKTEQTDLSPEEIRRSVQEILPKDPLEDSE